MLFGKVRGQGEVLSDLKKSIVSGDFEGAYLFSGPPSVGKFTVAKYLARYLICTGLMDDTCRCESCRLYPAVPDYLEISKNGESINVADIDVLKKFISLVPYRAKHRVCVIDDAHNLNPTTTNELLKILEDLQDNCIIILVSGQPERISPILVSRCYRVEFGRLGSEDIKEILKSQGYETGKVEELSKAMPYLSGNILRDFSKYSDQLKVTLDFLRNFEGNKEDDTIALLKDLDGKQDLEYFVEMLTVYLNDLIKVRYDSPDVVFNVKKLDQLMDLTGVWKEDLCVMLLEKLRAVHQNMDRSINLKLIQYIIPVFCWVHYYMKKAVDAPQ